MPSTMLPPPLCFSSSTSMVYACQKSIYAIASGTGAVIHTYPIQGMGYPTVAADIPDMLYLTVQCHADSFAQARLGSDGTPLWSYQSTHRLAPAAPTIVEGVVYVSTVEGTISALDAQHGTLFWRTRIGERGVSASLGPIVFFSPTVADGIVYLAPAINEPLQPFVYAVQARDGLVLWKVPLPASPLYPLILAEGIMYLSTSSRCLALDVSNGSLLWQTESGGFVCSAPFVVDGTMYFTQRVVGWKEGQAGIRREPSVCALRASDGSLLWQQEIKTSTRRLSALLSVDDTLLITDDNGSLFALRRDDGTVIWSTSINATVLSTPVREQNILFIGGNDGSVSALRVTDGALLWRVVLGPPLLAEMVDRQVPQV